MDIHLYHHTDAEEPTLLRAILAKLEAILLTNKDILDAVTRQTTVEQSLITLVTSISQQLKDALAANDQGAIQAVIDQIDANTTAMANAVTANTPAAPPAPASPPPPPAAG